MANYRQWYNGVLLYYKSAGSTSHDDVMAVRKIISQRRIGHAGTLDPLAEGLLVMCIGRATKIVRFLVGCDKTYEAEIYLGKRSRTFDGEGIYQDQSPKRAPDMSDKEIIDLLSNFKGKIKQQVPAYSAVRVNGKRLYASARQGEDVHPPIRDVEIKELTLLEYKKPYLKLCVTCSSGTYIRSLAEDFGNKLGCGGYLSHLKRTAVGQLSVDDCLTLSEVEQYHQTGQLADHLLQYNRVLPYSAIRISDAFRPYVISGKDITINDIVGLEGAFNEGDQVILKDSEGQVLAIGTAEVASAQVAECDQSKLFNYVRVLN